MCTLLYFAFPPDTFNAPYNNDIQTSQPNQQIPHEEEDEIEEDLFGGFSKVI